VADTGIGMDEDTRSRAFEPFFTTKEPGKGTGLGLATVYGIVEQSGGHVVVQSTPGEGTAVTVFLPLVSCVDSDAETPRLAPGPAGGSETVLLAEDEPVVRRLVREILERSGYRVLEAASGLEAVELAERTAARIDLLLTDIVMPDMSGRELVDRLSERWPELRIVYMSGYPGGVLGHTEALTPGTTFLQKPFPIHGLAQIVRNVLDGPPPPREAIVA
jgi:CheY-like chemotaxis protein